MKRGKPNPEIVDRMASECLAVRVRLINRVITGLYDAALRPFGLRISQANILAAVGKLGEVRPADLSRILRIEKSTLSRDVELMKRNGWLASEPPGGGRNQKVRLSPEGTQLLIRMGPAWEKAQRETQELVGPRGESAVHEMAGRLGFGQSNR